MNKLYKSTITTLTDGYFGKIVLLIIISIASYYVFKHYMPERLFNEQVTTNDNMVMDSLMLDAVANDTPANTADGAAGGVDIEVDENFNPLITADGSNNLKRFYGKLYALEQTKSGKVRVAYYGDSMNDGDYIVQDIRSEFQSKYGGNGVGFVPLTSLSANARGSVSHEYSKNWITQSFIKTKKPSRPFGPDGQVFFTPNGGQSYMFFKAQSLKNATTLNSPTLFYGKSGNDKAQISIEIAKDSILKKELKPIELVNQIDLCGDLVKLKVSFTHTDSIPFYGFNFDDEMGIHIDNFSMRGNSGLPLAMLDSALMNAFDKELHYDLIILQYGANVLNYGTLDYGWYEKKMTAAVNNLHKCFPNADILIISTADKSSKKEGVMKTDAAVMPLILAQKKYARNTRSGFINLYDLMGGENSMAKWVDENKDANKDYTHFNQSGSKKIAKLLSDEIERGYAKYKKDQVKK